MVLLTVPKLLVDAGRAAEVVASCGRNIRLESSGFKGEMIQRMVPMMGGNPIL